MVAECWLKHHCTAVQLYSRTLCSIILQKKTYFAAHNITSCVVCMAVLEQMTDRVARAERPGITLTELRVCGGSIAG